MSAAHDEPLEACGNLVRTKRTAEGGGWLVAECSTSERAEQIALRFNAHDELVAALGDMLDVFALSSSTLPAKAAVKRARAAIALAGGATS